MLKWKKAKLTEWFKVLPAVIKYVDEATWQTIEEVVGFDPTVFNQSCDKFSAKWNQGKEKSTKRVRLCN